LYAGLGGNRKLWENVNVTAVELDPRIASVYGRLNPADTVVVEDAHQYLLDHGYKFDFIWSSPPCQTHSRMAKATKHKHLRRYPDMSLYQEIIYLQHFFRGKWVVENVKPFYAPLIPPKILGRHAYWANFDVGDYCEPSPPGNIAKFDNLAGKQVMMDWLGIHYPENIYYGTNHCPVQILRNCVHPNEGLSIFRKAFDTSGKTGA
jgi:DNA (cytosine-5)-methyltransferase 1